MFKLHLKQAIRNLIKHKVYSLINIAGLAIAGAFIILVALYARHAMLMDAYSPRLKNVYRIEMTDLWRSGDKPAKNGFFDKLAKVDEVNHLTTPLALALALKKDFPEVKTAVRFGGIWRPVITVNQQKFKENGESVAQVDAAFFSMMDLPIVAGNPQCPFVNNSSVVISEKAAKKYFGNTNPIGQTISVSEIDNTSYTISAIAKNFPTTSSMQYDIMLPLEGDPGYSERLARGNNTMSFITLLELKAGTNIKNFADKLNQYGQLYFKDITSFYAKQSNKKDIPGFHLSIRPYADGHYNLSHPWPYFTDLKSLYQLISLAILALAIAAINYILLSLSRIAARSQEAGVRKTLGAGSRQIVYLFLTETFVLVIISMILAGCLATAAMPLFNAMTHVQLQAAAVLQIDVAGLLLLLSVLLTLLAGVYPALQMAGISALSMMKRFGTYKVNPALSKAFITLQYTACTVLILLAIVVSQQMQFVYNKDLGFDTEQILTIENPYAYNDDGKSLVLRLQLKQYAATQPAFTNMTGAGGKYGHSNTNGHIINGTREQIKAYQVDFGFFEFSKIPILQGRSFSAEYPIDSIRQNFSADAIDSNSSRTMSNIVVNETLYKMLGEPQLNVINRSLGSIIVGVCADYHFNGLYEKPGPAYHTCRPKTLGYFWLKIAAGQNLITVMDKLKATWPTIAEQEPLSFSFLKDDIGEMYESHSRWMNIINTASWLAVFIACLGLFGLSAVTAINRTKEMGIRKILGASLLQLFYSLNKGTILLVLMSITLAIPIASMLAKDWLQNFAYRISLHWSLFVSGAFIALACALVAISYHTYKTANSNPVESLNTE